MTALEPEEVIPSVSVAELERRWNISRNALKARAKAIGVVLTRQGPTLTTWPGDRLNDGDRLDLHLKAGGAMATFRYTVRLSNWIEHTGLSRSTAYELLKLLGIEPEARRVPSSRKPVSHLTASDLKLLKPWADEIRAGATLPQIRDRIGRSEPIGGCDLELVPLAAMADLADRWGVTPNTVSRRLSFLGIKPIRQGNYRFLDAEQLALAEQFQQHILSGKPMEAFHSAPCPGDAAPANGSDAASLLARLEAAQLATSSGLGLATAEVHWILGVIPGTSPLTRAGITATRTGENCWKLDRT